MEGMYHLMTWPQISFVAEDSKGRIVGYVLAKMCVHVISHPIAEVTSGAERTFPKKTLYYMAISTPSPSCGHIGDSVLPNG